MARMMLAPGRLDLAAQRPSAADRAAAAAISPFVSWIQVFMRICSPYSARAGQPERIRTEGPPVDALGVSPSGASEPIQGNKVMPERPRIPHVPQAEAERPIVEVPACRLCVCQLDAPVVVEDNSVRVSSHHGDYALPFEEVQKLLSLGRRQIHVLIILIGILDEQRIVTDDEDPMSLVLCRLQSFLKP